jgi:hypothetical protein
MTRLLLLGQLVLLPLFASAQSIIIKRVQLAGEKIIVLYELEDSNPNNEYLLNLYSSKDNFATAVTNVTGDVGMDIKPGTEKKMEWNIVKEYGGYKGKLSLEIRGKVYIPLVRLKNFDPGATYRRGKNYTITWKAGNSNPVNIELYKGGQRITGEVNHPNNGSYELFIPPHAKPGGDYKIKFSDARSPDDVVFTQPFNVKAKYPLLVKIVPVVIVAAVVVVLVTKKKPATGDNGGQTPTVTDMEDPGFPTNH